MISDIENIKNRGITADVLHIIKENKSPYFNAKSIKFELFKKHGISLRGRPSSNDYDIHHLKTAISCKFGHIVRKLKSLGYIEKITNSTWKRLKIINLKSMELYSKEEIKLMKNG